MSREIIDSRRSATEEVSQMKLDELNLEKRRARGIALIFVTGVPVLLLFLSGIAFYDDEKARLSFSKQRFDQVKALLIKSSNTAAAGLDERQDSEFGSIPNTEQTKQFTYNTFKKNLSLTNSK